MPNGKLIAAGAAVAFLAAAPAEAYIGPGAGAGTIAVVLGILASILMAFFALLWYPFKRMRKRRKAATQPAVDGKADDGDDSEET